MHNQYVNQIRRNVRSGTTVDLDDAASFLSHPANQDKCLDYGISNSRLISFLRASAPYGAALPAGQRAAINLVGQDRVCYVDASVALGIRSGRCVRASSAGAAPCAS